LLGNCLSSSELSIFLTIFFIDIKFVHHKPHVILTIHTVFAALPVTLIFFLLLAEVLTLFSKSLRPGFRRKTTDHTHIQDYVALGSILHVHFSKQEARVYITTRCYALGCTQMPSMARACIRTRLYISVLRKPQSHARLPERTSYFPRRSTSIVYSFVLWSRISKPNSDNHSFLCA
jgi:hypothetical protein